MPALATKPQRFIQQRIAQANPLVQKIHRRIARQSDNENRGTGPSEYVPHYPTEKQAAFLALDDREAMYGGAAGGGKSDALLMAALQYVSIPGYNALLLRRTFADLIRPGALMDRARQWLLPTRARWIGDAKAWLFPSGATLSFGYIDCDADLKNYQSSEYQFVGYDELTHFRENWYTYLFSRMRKLVGVPIPLRMRSATNPGQIGHQWVKARFVSAAKAYKRYVLATDKGRCFVPALLSDNPHIDRETYTENLSELDPVTLAQLLNGDWDAAVGGTMFRRDWFKEVDALPEQYKRIVRRWDLAASEPTVGYPDPDWTVGMKVMRTEAGLYVCHMDRFRKLPGEVEKRVLSMARSDGRKTPVRIEQEGGSSGKSIIHAYTTKLIGYDIKGVKSTGSKAHRARPASAQAQVGNIYVLKAPWNKDFYEELEAFSEDDSMVIHDDIVDALSGAVSDLTEEQDKSISYGG